MGKYRIRWSNRVQGSWDGHRTMCLAQRHIRVFGLIPLWWPLDGADWRDSEAEAERDIADDMYRLRKLPPDRYIDSEV